MTYVYDILLNFMDGIRVYESFEWQKKDGVEHIKRIPLFYVDSNVLYDAVNSEVVFSSDLLEKIENKTITFSSNNDVVKYACLFSDGNRCYALEFNNDGKIIYKSSLLLDEEDEVLELCFTLSKFIPKYSILKDIKKEQNVFTREEARRKNFIEKDLIYTYKNKNYSKLNYLYSECCGKSDITYKEKLDILLKDIGSCNSVYRNKLNFILELANKKNLV